jgi:hemolysin activation/secretion protein
LRIIFTSILAGVIFFTVSPRVVFGQAADTSPSVDSSRVDERVKQYELRTPNADRATPLPAVRDGETPKPSSAEETILAAVIVEGARTLTPDEISPTYEDLLVRSVTMEDIAAIAERITQLYRDRGFFLTRAYIPPQTIASGVIRVRVLEGAIVETAVSGSDHRRSLVEDHLARIRIEDPARLETMERSILLIGDIPGLFVSDARIEEIERATGRFKLTADLGRSRFEAYSSLDNRGDPDAGRSQLWTSGTLLGGGSLVDRLQIGVFTIPEAPRELMYGEVKVARLIGSEGVEVETRVSASESEPGPDGTETSGIDSESQRATLTLSIPVYRRRDTSYWGRIQLDARAVQDSQNGSPILTDHLRVARAAVQGSTGLLGGNTWSRLEVSAGDTILGGSAEEGDRSRYGADSSFAKVNLEVSHYRDLTDTIGIYGYLSGQYADDALLSAEEFAVGGLQIGRGYDYSEISGDHGIAGLVELRYGRRVDLSLLESYQFYGFYDAGVVWNKGEFEDPRDTLASAGFGVRLSMPRSLNLELEAAHPLTRPTNAEGSRPWLGFVTLSASF